MDIKPHERHYQVGNIIEIKLEPPKARRTGFFLGTKHIITVPPDNYLNSPMSVWVKDRLGVVRSLQFMYWEWTGKVEKPKRVRNK